VVIGTLLGLLGSIAWVVNRRYAALARDRGADSAAAWHAMRQAWRLRR